MATHKFSPTAQLLRQPKINQSTTYPQILTHGNQKSTQHPRLLQQQHHTHDNNTNTIRTQKSNPFKTYNQNSWLLHSTRLASNPIQNSRVCSRSAPIGFTVTILGEFLPDLAQNWERERERERENNIKLKWFGLLMKCSSTERASYCGKVKNFYTVWWGWCRWILGIYSQIVGFSVAGANTLNT